MAKNRDTVTENDKLILFSEVEGTCPICLSQLMYRKANQNSKGFQIAHIYPLNPNPDEIDLLKYEKILSSDPNDLDNLICLCPSCHTKFDKPRSLNGYREIVNIKENLIREANEKYIWNNTNIENEIQEIIKILETNDFDFNQNDNLNYDPKEIDGKVNRTITLPTKRKIHRNVQDYYHIVKAKFTELESTSPSSTDLISSQIKTHYLSLVKQQKEANQKNIFDAMVIWLRKKTKQNTNDASEIIISYFIQNCEVFK